MAQAPHNPGEGGASFVRDIVADPKNVPDVALLYGYLGASSEEGHERLYLSPDLSNYVEVPAKAILHRAHAAKEQDPHGGVTLWVKKDAALQYKMAPAQQALAQFFAGAIQAGAAAAPAAAPQPTPPQTIFGCTVAPALCPATVAGPLCTQGNTCGIDCSVVCPTRNVTCPVGCGVDSFVLCPTHRPPCPTHPPHASCFPNCTQRTPCPGVSCGIDCTVIRTPCPGASCGVDCTVVGPLCQQTRPPHATCLPACTHAGPCLLTHGQPQCPFPTEICTHVHACSPLPGCGDSVGACPSPLCTQQNRCVPPAGFAGAAGCANQTNLPGSFVDCSIVCPTRFNTCVPCGGVDSNVLCPTHILVCRTHPPHATCGVDCSIVCPTRHVTCFPGCTIDSAVLCPTHVTCNIWCQATNPAFCPIASGLAACAPQNPGGPIEQQVQAFNVGGGASGVSVCACQTFEWPCPTYWPGCGRVQ